MGAAQILFERRPIFVVLSLQSTHVIAHVFVCMRFSRFCISRLPGLTHTAFVSYVSFMAVLTW